MRSAISCGTASAGRSPNSITLPRASRPIARNSTAIAAPIILIQGLTPIPFKLVAIASGLAQVNFATFVLCAAATRSARFFLVAGLMKRFGEPMRAFIEKRMTLVGWAVLGLAIVIGVALWLL